MPSPTGGLGNRKHHDRSHQRDHAKQSEERLLAEFVVVDGNSSPDRVAHAGREENALRENTPVASVKSRETHARMRRHATTRITDG